MEFKKDPISQQLEHVHRPGMECPACSRSQQLLHVALTASLTFKEAFVIWLAHRTIESNGIRTDASYLAPKSVSDYKCCALALGKFFNALRLDQIHPGYLMEYQQARAICDKSAGDWARPAGANRIRKEITLLIRILRAAGVWGDVQKFNFSPLRAVESDVPRSMSPEEQHRFLHIASSREEWQFIYWYSIVALQTTASTNEMRALRLGDILLRDGVIQIRRAAAKNKYRIRTIPLVTPDVAWALERLIERAREMGAVNPSHCLFPICAARGTYDPTRPMSDSGLKKRWHQVRTAAGLPWLRPYDLRHTGITRMAEAGSPIQVIMSMAGHMTMRMQQHYTAVSQMAKRGWLTATWGNEACAAPEVGKPKAIGFAATPPSGPASSASLATPWLHARRA